MTRPAAYIRVSRAEQVEGYSLDAQIRAIEDFCRARGWDAPTFYTEPGKSAYTDVTEERPAFAELLEVATAGGHDTIVVHRLDRFARSLITTLRELRRLEQSGVGFVSINENIDFTTPIGRVLLALLASFAEYYSRNLSVETKKGLHEKKRQGFHVGYVPWGARRVGGLLSVDPDLADDLRLAYELFGEKSQQAAADELNARGIPAPRGGRWYPSQIYNMRGKQGEWLREMGGEWAALYERASRKAHVPPVNRADRVYHLTGLLRCTCGGWIGYHAVEIRKRDGVERRYGRCRNNANPARRGCTTWGTTLSALEEEATALLFALPDPRKEAPVPVEPGAREAFEAKRRRVMAMYREGLYKDEEEWAREKAALFAEESRLPVSNARRVKVGLGLDNARLNWHNWGDEERNAWWRGLVERFVVDRGTLRPVFRPLYAAIFGREGQDGDA